MKKHLLAIALFALCTTGLNAASPKKVAPEKKGVETINRATAEAHIGFLACDELEGREAGWKGGRIAGNYIISCLKQMGIKPLLAGDYIQPFDVYHAERQVKRKTLASTSRFYCGTEKKWYIKNWHYVIS